MSSEILIYQTEDGQTKIQTRLENETVWLTQEQISDLFQRDRSVITKHIGNVFKEGELDEKSNVQILHISGSDRPVKFYNLDVIISVGYRVKSHRGVQFRKWATSRIKEYIVKGFTMNDELLKEAGGGNYFDELLARIRDIRSSEKVFWRKVLDIYATSIDYDPNTEISTTFFKTVQNKMHWAAHGNTAAEVIYKRIDAGKKNLGLTNFKGAKPTKKEIEVAKNYLNEQELEILNRIVTAYLEMAELQAMNRKPMYMKDWVSRLDDFLTMTGNEILTHAGKISHQKALGKAHSEYEKFKEKTKNELSQVEKDFIENIDKTAKQLKNKKK
ncbi:cell filamentation protein Fic [Echinicola strongylocentroti]|uniref:Cell filamentation protein Fic n=1 Tax=Echinicola strongylocentroti TaxID=1795355 RepID=A0A2Z4IHH6_9BACT|nr:virulence RhuM family protein [Echinicola strongylocentroti]AWW30147.1 cell filamentation protein Fic [Echinicola strongylocentroti]